MKRSKRSRQRGVRKGTWKEFWVDSSRFRRIALWSVVLAFGALAIWYGYSQQGAPYSGFGAYSSPASSIIIPAKTIWDWLELLIIPLTLLVGGYQLNKTERNRELAIADERSEETALQTYLDQMANLLIEKQLGSAPRAETEDVARVWTLTIMRRINAERKRIVMDFLYESKLIRGADPRVSLETADLSFANLRQVKFKSINLKGAYLHNSPCVEADFSEGNLSNASFANSDLAAAQFIDADLSGAYLSDAYMDGANFTAANLTSAQLKRSDLAGANFKRAKLKNTYFQGAQLEGAQFADASLEYAFFRDATYDANTTWPADFDPAQEGAILVGVAK